MLPGGHSWEFFVGVYNPALQNMILSQTKKYHFHTRFQTWPLKFIPVFRLRFELVRSTCGIFLFLSYSFGIETINTFIHSRNSLENHTRFQTKMDKVYTRFQTFGAAHTYMACTREYTPPGKKLYPSTIPSTSKDTNPTSNLNLHHFFHFGIFQNRYQAVVFDLVENRKFEMFIISVITINMLVMMAQHYGQPPVVDIVLDILL